MRIGIFGGSFNPPHNGHINAISTVAKKIGLDKVHVVVASQNPIKTPVDGPTPEERYELTKAAFSQYGDQFFVDNQEILRGGRSFTIETIESLRKTVEAKDLFLIVGADKLEELSKWKDWQKILTEANLVVTTRPGFDLPTDQESLPDYLQPLIEEYDFNFVELTTGRSIQFLTLKDVEISGTELRKWLRAGRPVEKYLPLSVESYIREHKMYRNLGDKIGDYKKFSEFCADVIFSKKGINLKGFDLTDISAPSEYTLIASGTSTRHAASMAENIIQAVKDEYGVFPQSVEGLDEGRWVLVDFGSLIVHLFYDFVRQEYNLEAIWKNAKQLQLEDPYIK